MNGMINGIEGIKAAIENGPRGESVFLKLADGDSVTLRFLNEMDESGATYDENRGLCYGFYEHLDPEDFTKSFVCTLDEEGKCQGCERIGINKRWRPKGRLFFNALIRGKRGETDVVKVFTTGTSEKGLAPQLVEYAVDYGSLCDRDYKLTRRGEGLKTSYTLTSRDVSPLSDADNAAELIVLTALARQLNYEEQGELLSGSTRGSDW